MSKILMVAIMIANMQSYMYLEGEGRVFPCLNEEENPYGTCFQIGTESWGIVENTDRPIGTRIKVRFRLDMVNSDEGDTYKITNVEIID